MRLKILFLLAFLALPLTFVQAQNSLTYGESVTGTLTDAAPTETWTFEGAAGDQITITMEATNPSEGMLDTFLRLLDPEGQVVTENDDASPVSTNSAIEEIILATDGTYTIEASRYGEASGTSSGDYALTVTLIAQGVESPDVPEAEPIAYNSPVTGTLDMENPDDRWTFEGTEGETITIRMSSTSGDLDSYLRLFDQAGIEIASNDDAAGTTNSEITAFSLPASGTYTLVATRYAFEAGTSSGGYTLEISTGQAATPVAPVVGELIAYGDFVSASVVVDTATGFNFEGQAGDVVTISVKRANSELDPALTLADSSGAGIVSNDQFNGAADARIENFALPETGTYSVVVTGDNGTSGDFVLYLFASSSTATVVTPTETAEPTVEPETTPEPEATPTIVENTLDLSGATLAITGSWAGSSDFDLTVTEPDGTVIDLIASESDSGGLFGGDANGGCAVQFAEPSESVYWETEPPTGTYQIALAYVLPCQDRGVHSFTITVTLNGEVVETFEGELNEGELATFEWEN